MTLTLYAGDPNSISIASHILLEELGLPYDLVRLDYAATEQRSANYLSINPKGRVPALATAEGILTETPAILTYLATLKPEAGLLPPPHLLPLPACNPSWPISARQCTRPMPTACAATDGLMILRSLQP
jgi:glutathione S-transferase